MGDLLNDLKATPDYDYLTLKHHLLEPRLSEAQYLASKIGVHAMMDISDGIASDLRHVLNASGCGAEIEMSDLPISDVLQRVAQQQGWNVNEMAISGGEDYE